MLSYYVLLYQYFDNQEVLLINRITTLQERVLYRDGRDFTVDEVSELFVLKIKLDFCRIIESDLLQLFYKL